MTNDELMTAIFAQYHKYDNTQMQINLLAQKIFSAMTLFCDIAFAFLRKSAKQVMTVTDLRRARSMNTPPAFSEGHVA